MLQKTILNFWKNTILNSYSQLFFSLDKLFALLILAVTFFEPKIGLTGLVAVIFINLFAKLIGLNTHAIKKGVYGFNALLLGMALGFEYQINGAFCILFSISIALLLVITVWINGFFEKKHLPFLVFPFLVAYWIIHIAAANFNFILLDESHAYIVNSIAKQQGSIIFQVAHCLDNLNAPNFILVYFKTLSGIFFQSSILAGVLLSIGLLYASRISFSLSIIGFASAILFFKLLGADINYMNYYLVGSNFILMSIAIGGFFLIPNKYSYLAVILLSPILIFILFFVEKTLEVFQLKSFTLSFGICVTIFIYFLQQRWLQKFLQISTIHYYSPEKTIYKYLNSLQRFKNIHLAKVYLPFWGTWTVSQGHDGTITHLGDWSKALDFVITDKNKETYKNFGIQKDNFYCFNKPIIAPMDGYVFDIINIVEDNEIGNVNTEKNWGNTIVINHLNGLFSQISHIKKDSFKVNIGDFISKGTTLAYCGNSGRSPEPHIHFQLQDSPTVGAKTITYPIAYFIEHQQKKKALKISEIPKENTLISNVETTQLLINAFDFKPGQTLKYKINDCDTVEWKILTDAYNRTYIYCAKKKSSAYFINDGTMFYFYDFEGDQNSYLFAFYLGFYKILLGFYQDIEINDNLPILHFNNRLINFIQDFFAPFYLFTSANYQSKFIHTDTLLSPEEIQMEAQINTTLFGKKIKEIKYIIEIKKNKIDCFSFTQNHIKTQFRCID